MNVAETVQHVLTAASAGALRVFDLSRPYESGMPQSPNHPVYLRALVRRHGDAVRADGTSGANDVLVMGTHVGTHIDALAHISHDGQLHGGRDAQVAQEGGGFRDLGAHTIDPIVGRGVLLDVPAALGREECEPGYEITPDDLDAACARQGVTVAAGDVVLIRSGWGRRWGHGPAYVGFETGVPGVAEAGARWLAERGVRAAGADSIAFERLAPGQGHAVLPAHRVLLVEHGIYLIETMNLEELAVAHVSEFLFICSPLRLVGATGAPVRPLAVVAA